MSGYLDSYTDPLELLPSTMKYSRPRERQYFPGKSRNYRSYYFTSVLLDIMQIGLTLIDISLYNLVPQKIFRSIYIQQRVIFILMVFGMNHVAGVIPFMYAYETVQQFPLVENYKEAPISFIIQVIQTVLMFLSFHIRMYGRQSVLKNDDGMRTELRHIFGRDIYETAPEKQYDELCSALLWQNCVSTIGQTLIFRYGVKVGKISREILYPVTVSVFILSFLTGYIFQLARNKLIKRLLDKKEVKKILKLTVVQSLYFGLFGLVLAGLADAVFSLWDVLSIYCKETNERLNVKSFPQFSSKQASSLVATIFSYMLVQSGRFGYYLSTPNCAFMVLLKNAQDRKLTNVVLQQATSLVKQIVWYMKDFLRLFQDRLLVDLIFAGVLATQNFVDLVQLGILLFSGTTFTNSTLVKASKTVSFILIWGLIAIYLVLLVVQVKKKSRLLGVLSFITGMIAIPSLLSQELIRSFIVDMAPEQLSDYLEQLITESIVPFTAIISFVQSVPVIFQTLCRPKQYECWLDVQKEAKAELLEIREVIQEAKIFGGLQNYTEVDVKDKVIDFEMVFQAAKYAKASYDCGEPRKAKRWIPKALEPAIDLQHFMVERRAYGISIGIQGSPPLLELSLDLFTKAIPSWAGQILAPVMEFQLENGETTWINWYLYRRAQAIYRRLMPMQIKKTDRFYISGHHQGGVVAAALAWLLYKKRGLRQIDVYGFNVPHLAGGRLMTSLKERIHEVVFFTVGYEQKLHFSSIVAPEIKWPDEIAISIPRGSMAGAVMDCLSILSAGGEPDDIMEDVQDFAEEQKIYDCKLNREPIELSESTPQFDGE